jgi:SAM-dependent methyltransferase
MKEVWSEHIADELSYWKSMIDGSFHNKDWVEGFRKRVKGADILAPHLHDFVQNADKILDVGSGPATVLGGSWKGRALPITAIDPLADQYNALFAEYGMQPAVKPIRGDAEGLQSVVSRDFDFVYSRNALDHSWNPIKAIQSMIDVCRAGGRVFFENVINEGVNEGYKGLHQWNFMPASNDLIVWKADGQGWIVSKELHGFESLSAYTIRDDWVAVEVRVD